MSTRCIWYCCHKWNTPLLEELYKYEGGIKNIRIHGTHLLKSQLNAVHWLNVCKHGLILMVVSKYLQVTIYTCLYCIVQNNFLKCPANIGVMFAYTACTYYVQLDWQVILESWLFVNCWMLEKKSVRKPAESTVITFWHLLLIWRDWPTNFPTWERGEDDLPHF